MYNRVVCDEDPEDKTVTTESFLKLPVNISSGSKFNYMHN